MIDLVFEKIRQVFDACMTALSNRLVVGGTKR